MKQQANTKLKGVAKGAAKMFFFALLVLLGGCGTLDTVTGKADVEMKKANLEQQLATYKAEQVKLKNTVANLETQLSAERATFKKKTIEYKEQTSTLKTAEAAIKRQLDTEQATFKKKEVECTEYREQIKKLEMSKAEGISIIFFGGDIIYKVTVDAFKSYKAGLRYRTLIDTNFASEFKMFEEGKGGDAIVLGLIKEIDISGDRIISLNEASRFRETEENKYGNGRMGLTSSEQKQT